MSAIPLKAYLRNPDKVSAGRITRVMWDEDNEDVPVMVWIDKYHYGLTETVIEDRDPEIGDWLVIPRDGAEFLLDKATILSNRMFHTLYADRKAKGAEAASSISSDLH